MGHTYSVIFRVTPIAGPSYTLAVSAYSHLAVAQPHYSPVTIDKQMVDFRVKQTRPNGRSWLCTVEMAFEFPTPSTNETTLADTLLTLSQDDDAMIELSLNGGTTYREVVLAQDFAQEAMDGKNIGVIQRMVWSCVDPLDSKPAVGSGAW